MSGKNNKVVEEIVMKRPTVKQVKMALDLAFDNVISYTIEGCYEMGMSKEGKFYSTQEQRIFASNLILKVIVDGNRFKD